MFPAMQSPEVAQEDQDDRPVEPVVAEAMLLAVRAGQSESRKNGKIHDARGYPRLASTANLGPSKVSVTWCKMVVR
jgi:hypothetical protein